MMPSTTDLNLIMEDVMTASDHKEFHILLLSRERIYDKFGSLEEDAESVLNPVISPKLRVARFISTL